MKILFLKVFSNVKILSSKKEALNLALNIEKDRSEFKDQANIWTFTQQTNSNLRLKYFDLQILTN